jgi:hypothetical protein
MSAPASTYEMIDRIEPDQADQDEVDGDDVVQQPWDDQDQNSRDEGDERRDVSDGQNHVKPPEGQGRFDSLQSIHSIHARRDTGTHAFFGCGP